MGVGVDQAFRQAGHVHDLPHPLVDALLIPAVIELLDDQGGGNGLADGHTGVEGGEGVLENDLHLPAQAFHLLGVHRQHILALEEHLAAGGLMEAQDGAAHRGLAAAGLPHHTQSLAGVNGKADVVHCMEHPVGHGEIFLQMFNL